MGLNGEEQQIFDPTQETVSLKTPDFIKAIGKDFPEEERRVLALLPEWEAAIDHLVGIPGLARQVLDATQYIGKEEIQSFILGIAQEAQQLLGVKRGEVNFLHEGQETKSGRYFFENILGHIPDSLKDRVRLLDIGDLHSFIAANDPRGQDFFLCDDAINSGMQFHEVANTLGFTISKRREDPGTAKSNLRVRVLRIADEGRKRIKTDADYYKKILAIDAQGKRMPVVDDILGKFRKRTNNNFGGLFHQSNALSFSPTTLGIFYHKFQDNLPIVYTGEKKSDPLISDGVIPLFKNTTLKPYPSLK